MTREGDLGCDVVVVGTGLGGSTFANALARRGFDVVVLEEGSFIRHASADLSPVHQAALPPGPHVGGMTKTFGAAMYRFRATDFQAAELEAGVSPEWPYGYADIEPHYSEAERLYRVHGSSDNDVTEPFRSTPWPYPPIPHQGPARELVRRLTERAGVPVSHIPRSIDYDPLHGGSCVLCRFCDAYFCPRDAKIDAEIGALRPALATGSVRLLTETQCLRVSTSPDGSRVLGVRARRGGVEFDVVARHVALAAGITGTPTLLWRSRTAGHPKGLGNGSGALGRYAAAHRQGWVFPLAPMVQRTPFHQKTFAVNAFYSSAPGWSHPLGTIQAAGYIEPLTFSRRYRPFISAVLYNTFQTFVMTESVPSSETGFALRDDGADRIGEPVVNQRTFFELRRRAIDLFRSAGYRVFAPRLFDHWHWVGSARMGANPSTSIVDGLGRSHDVEGLYIVDASALPSAGAVNTGLTIAAHALRAASAIPAS